MTFKTSYWSVFQQVEAKLKTISSVKQVALGEEFTVQKLPLAIVTPNISPITQAEIGKPLMVTVKFDVTVVVKEVEAAKKLEDVITVLADVFDGLIADRKLNGKVLDLTPTVFAPLRVGFPTQKWYVGGVISWEALVYHTPA